MEKRKVIIIGAGPAGYVAAIRASQLGAEVTLVEKETIGGTCLNRGCIPTKSLVSSIEVLNLTRRGEEFGLEVGETKPNFSWMMNRKDRIVSQLRRGVHYLLSRNNIKLLQGKASFLAPYKIKVETPEGMKEIEGERIIIATGSKPILLPFINADHPTVLTSEKALTLKEVPQNLIILGAGVIGCEFTSIFNRLGSKITIVEMMDQILPKEDRGVARQMEQIFQKEGINVFTKTKLERITRYQNDKITVELDNGKEITANKILVCIGRTPYTEDLGLENLGLELDDKGNIKVNERMETNIKGIYAAGDVVGEPLLAHVAFKEGIVAAENALGIDSKMNYNTIPHCIFTFPQIGTVGLTADAAREKDIRIKMGRFSFAANGKAQAMGETRGFVQMIVEEDSGKILGAQIIGPQATELIHEIALSIKWGATVEELGNLPYAHPTLSETVMEAALSAQGKPIHSI